jgi:hypothetical protein
MFDSYRGPQSEIARGVDAEMLAEVFDTIRDAANDYQTSEEPFTSLISLVTTYRWVPRRHSKGPRRQSTPLGKSEFSTAAITDHDFAEFFETAVANNRYDELKALIADPRFDRNKLLYGTDGKTMLHVAARYDHDRILRLILQVGVAADVVDSRCRHALS